MGRIPSKFRPTELFSYTFIPNNLEALRKNICLDVRVNTLQFWSCDGIQIFTVDLVSDLLIGRHMIIFFAEIAYGILQ